MKKQGKIKRKLDSHISSCQRLINDPAKEVKLISTKGFRKDLINGLASC